MKEKREPIFHPTPCHTDENEHKIYIYLKNVQGTGHVLAKVGAKGKMAGKMKILRHKRTGKEKFTSLKNYIKVAL